MARYYNLPLRLHLKSDWEDHTLRDGKPGCLFPDLSRKLTRLWEIGVLNEWNRYDAAYEAKLRPSSLPLNQQQEPVDEPRERVWIDALMPPEAMTPRRACLRDLDEARHLGAEAKRRRAASES
jgi:hypothetical protein